ncbi:hypothetical protein DFH07DRAFT_767579 [Mycena maculata]|uniref:Uncharacterized protein n=1 Tax=Mycena maculata TaxID=230809 RepID=A0AAD7JWZ3_9AGAR|nr:hypothetical protein DFH07DRAFT_767579 [Mycena maculata]
MAALPQELIDAITADVDAPRRLARVDISLSRLLGVQPAAPLPVLDFDVRHGKKALCRSDPKPPPRLLRPRSPCQPPHCGCGNPHATGKSVPTPHQSAVCGDIRRRLAILVLKCMPQVSRSIYTISLLSLPTLRPLDRCCGVPAALLRHALASLDEVALQVRVDDIDFGRNIKFVKPSASGSLVRLVVNYSPFQVPDFHSLVLNSHPKHLELVLPAQMFRGLEEVVLKHAAPPNMHTDILLSSATSQGAPSGLRFLTVVLDADCDDGRWRLEDTQRLTIDHALAHLREAQLFAPISVILRWLRGLYSVSLDDLRDEFDRKLFCNPQRLVPFPGGADVAGRKMEAAATGETNTRPGINPFLWFSHRVPLERNGRVRERFRWQRDLGPATSAPRGRQAKAEESSLAFPEDMLQQTPDELSDGGFYDRRLLLRKAAPLVRKRLRVIAGQAPRCGPREAHEHESVLDNSAVDSTLSSRGHADIKKATKSVFASRTTSLRTPSNRHRVAISELAGGGKKVPRGESSRNVRGGEVSTSESGYSMVTRYGIAVKVFQPPYVAVQSTRTK